MNGSVSLAYNVYKLGDVGIPSNLIVSLSVANGQCQPPLEVDDLWHKTMAAVNSR